jgi:hypothetical protein
MDCDVAATILRCASFEIEDKSCTRHGDWDPCSSSLWAVRTLITIVLKHQIKEFVCLLYWAPCSSMVLSTESYVPRLGHIGCVITTRRPFA